MNSMLTRDQAWDIVCEFIQSDGLRKHALAVESCLRAYGEQEAARLGLVGEDITQLVEIYAATGLRVELRLWRPGQ